MPTIRRFEDLEVWQLARQQCREIFLLIQSGVFADDRPLRDQINRSSGSVMDNISEGFDRFTRVDFRHFLVVARGSNAEVRAQLYRAADRAFLETEAAERLMSENILIGRKLNKLIQYLGISPYPAKPSTPRPTVEEPDSAYNSPSTLELPDEFIIRSS